MLPRAPSTKASIIRHCEGESTTISPSTEIVKNPFLVMPKDTRDGMSDPSRAQCAGAC